MADIIRSAKSGSQWTHYETDAYNIHLSFEDAATFFGGLNYQLQPLTTRFSPSKTPMTRFPTQTFIFSVSSISPWMVPIQLSMILLYPFSTRWVTSVVRVWHALGNNFASSSIEAWTTSSSSFKRTSALEGPPTPMRNLSRGDRRVSSEPVDQDASGLPVCRAWSSRYPIVGTSPTFYKVPLPKSLCDVWNAESILTPRPLSLLIFLTSRDLIGDGSKA
ncbi:hypothetical protein B0H13DRAFT_2658265 [Mycena leptocephala]|nr:hypothetical protein B0H13DRAFT_2658265 [Mycena leptocephala]